MAVRGPAWWLVGLGGVLVFVLARIWFTAETGFSTCIFRSVLDLPCPGCGLTRATGHLARGSLETAFKLHPMVFPLAVETVVAWVMWGLVGGARVHRFVSDHVGPLVLANVVPLIALWLGRAATGSLP